jgi:hemin uptake protein HemP
MTHLTHQSLASEAPLQTQKCLGDVQALRVVSSLELFHGKQQVVIMHLGQRYQLRITKSEKLILTK